MRISGVDTLHELLADSILVASGEESALPYVSGPVRLIRCDALTFGRLMRDLSSLARWEGEAHRLELVNAGLVFGDFGYEIRTSDSLTFSPLFTPVHSYLRQIISGEASDLRSSRGEPRPAVALGSRQ